MKSKNDIAIELQRKYPTLENPNFLSFHPGWDMAQRLLMELIDAKYKAQFIDYTDREISDPEQYPDLAIKSSNGFRITAVNLFHAIELQENKDIAGHSSRVIVPYIDPASFQVQNSEPELTITKSEAYDKIVIIKALVNENGYHNLLAGNFVKDINDMKEGEIISHLHKKVTKRTMKKK